MYPSSARDLSQLEYQTEQNKEILEFVSNEYPLEFFQYLISVCTCTRFNNLMRFVPDIFSKIISKDNVEVIEKGISKIFCFCIRGMTPFEPFLSDLLKVSKSIGVYMEIGKRDAITILKRGTCLDLLNNSLDLLKCDDAIKAATNHLSSLKYIFDHVGITQENIKKFDLIHVVEAMPNKANVKMDFLEKLINRCNQD